MDESNSQQTKPLVIKKIFNAPRQTVWQAWTDPDQFSKWWSPDGFTVPKCDIDVRPEGKFEVDMQGPDGTLYPSTGTFKDVIEFERLSFVNSPLDSAGNKLFEILQTIVFRELGEQTELEVTAEVISETPEAAPYLAGMEQGINQALNKLNDLVEQGE